jgi:1-deoxy-D-xylulose-5-phosphate synthase
VIPSFEEIDSPQQLKELPLSNLNDYTNWLRNYLIEQIAKYGGHFAANLGVIELSVALHRVFDTPKDILIWDVGHQAYAHKILTKRKSNFHTLRQFDGISGFPKMSESSYDPFGTAHSSTSISAALGYAQAAVLKKIDRQHIAVIGDGALSAGQAFEALNNAGTSNCNICIIINDNHIGIDPSQGALGEYLEQLEFKKENFFTDLGFQYLGPIDGHDLNALISVLEKSKLLSGPKIIHIKTLKGKGYEPAELEQTKWHSTSQFDKLSGKNTKPKDLRVKFQDIFGKTLLEIAKKDENVVAVTPAMVSGSSLHFMQEVFPNRVFDVGIAEQHAITFSAGLAASGMTVFCCIYSTFLQRGYDQLIHDVALQNLPVIFAIDRAGLVGEDGPTHHGVFDLAFLQTIPNICIISPRNQVELRNAIYTASIYKKGPIIIRYPRGQADEAFNESPFEKLEIGSSVALSERSRKTALISIGTIGISCQEIAEKLNISHYDLRFVKPLDHSLLKKVFELYNDIIVIEEGQEIGSVASTIMLEASKTNSKTKIHSISIKDHFVSHGSMETLYQIEGLSISKISEQIHSIISQSVN